MDKDILAFIKKQTVATVSCVDGGAKPYCFAVFYAWDAEQQLLIFKSPADTHHSAILLQHPAVAGTIHADRLNKLIVQGIQWEGTLLSAENAAVKNAFGIYHKKHPLAIVKPGELWVIQVNRIKMTDSSKGFGTKIRWARGE